MMKLLIATFNEGKVHEYRALLHGLGLQLVSLVDIGIETVIEETGSTFRENALLKARGCAEMAGLWTLADDSGLEVDALDGAPGIYSSRYAGPGATDAANVGLLLERLAGVPPDRRAARFRCVIALVSPNGRAWTCEGTCEGTIAAAPRGTNGFGYDPVFYLPGRGKTMAELSTEEKNRISHRAEAAAHLRALFCLIVTR